MLHYEKLKWDNVKYVEERPNDNMRPETDSRHFLWET